MLPLRLFQPGLLILLVFAARPLSAQVNLDTLFLNLPQAQAQFVKSNLGLLAAQFNVEAATALAIQQRLYPNPVVSAEVNAYDPQNNEVLHTGPTGQKAFSIQQLILTGGKRRTQIELAKGNVQLAQLELEDLLRTLNFQLHKSFFTLHQANTVIHNYDQQLALIDTLVGIYQVQAQKGNISVKEVVRLKAVYLNLSNERSQLANARTEALASLQLLLGTQAYLRPIVTENDYTNLTKTFALPDLQAQAALNRPDLKQARLGASLAQTNLTLQRQLAIPDVTVGAAYDQRGGAFQNQVNLGVSLPLPVFNNNRGGIRQAGAIVRVQQTAQQAKALEIQAQVARSLSNYERSLREYRKAASLFTADFPQVFQGVLINFRRRNISILEFVDFVESYNLSLLEMERTRAQLANSAGELSYTTATPLY